MMPDSPAPDDSLAIAIQQSLQELAVQMDHPISEQTSEQVYQEAVELLRHMAYPPITLARLAGTLLFYQVQTVELDEVEWFKSQVQHCVEAEEVEELIASIHRTDAL